MDYQFPERLFPCFYNDGPPSGSVQSGAEAGGWGCYYGALPQGVADSPSGWSFTSKHQVRGQTWRQTEPVAIPLLSPKKAFLGVLTPPDPLDFTEHMQNFYVNYGHDAFGCMSDILGEHFYFRFGKKQREKHRRGSVSMWTMKNFIKRMKYKTCHLMFGASALGSYCSLLSDVVLDVPPELLGSLLHEELTEQRDRLLFSERTTGGALAFVPFSRGRGCLACPGGPGLNRLNFHRVELQRRGVELSSREPHSFQLEAPIRQISHASLLNDCCVAVRSDYLCGAWRFSETNEPRLLQVVSTREAATCVSVSPHVLGEVLVASESGAANLWTVGRGLQKVRVEDANLYFNAKSWWRWCEFSAHPRVILYADRTGVELTDVRAVSAAGLTLFRISSTAACRSGECLLQSRYLGDAHPFHHLVATQYSAYVMDERFPCVPMLKWDHMMEAPPIFCHAVPRAAGSETAGVLLGSQSSQEITLLQYSGGRVQPCFSLGPPQALLRPRESLRHLPVQIPHRLETATNRLSAPAAGLTCIRGNAGGGPDGEECVCVLQLTEAGDVFYQVLKQNEDPSDRRRPETSAPSAEAQLVVSDTSSDEEIIGPTQAAAVPETQTVDSDSSEARGGRRRVKRTPLPVFVNDDPDAATTDGEEKRSGRTPAAPGSRTLHTWKVWLQKLTYRSGEKALDSDLLTAETKNLLTVPDGEARGAEEEQREESLRRELKACMSSRSLLLLRGSASSAAPVPGAVDPEEWTDALSRRLTVSWRGEEAWRAWWHDNMGLNVESKVEALRRKRRREKQARRAAGRRLELSGSFTSTVSYQTELDGFSSSAEWSSAASQGAWSDVDSDGVLSKLDRFLSTPLHVQTDGPVPTPTPTPQRDENHEQQIVSASQRGSPDTTSSSQRRTKHPARDDLSSLFETQDNPAAAASCQVSSSQPVPPRTTRDVFASFASSQPASRAPQGRRGPPQASQTQKKKPRMGF
ncbi:TATA box-binding protein-associated factor RNA polymerase I subunit C [Kryptolebias marmoratus]|uniref:TATA-box binding protein associated factor, RNA polymerase I subunit C n=1 Tax=Kryptolebias marmoratus TaxID=37003 RepID=A0A3Q3A116_KRYMA|nr:TATA box-binding protein-associated factor RNA polymerase I subunit C [Kryptolebias marmoratus]XP_037835466.1 TATA box-binding protein-associated factor RNA polymerase I subunit C [Kryptolebias marmoratus]